MTTADTTGSFGRWVPAVAEVIVHEDPVLRARAFLRHYFPRVEVAVPSGWPFREQLIVLTDAGGRGEYDTVLSECLLTIEVSAPRIAQASLTARQVHALLRAWPDMESGVYFRSTVSRPAFTPVDETRTPAYTLTVAIAFRGEEQGIPAQ